MSDCRRLPLYLLVALAMVAAVGGWYYIAVDAVAIESGADFPSAALSAEGIIYALRAIILAVMIGLVFKFLVVVKDQ